MPYRDSSGQIIPTRDHCHEIPDIGWAVRIIDPVTRQASYLKDARGEDIIFPKGRVGEITAQHSARIHRAKHPEWNAQVVKA